jgi:hypothetical protein
VRLLDTPEVPQLDLLHHQEAEVGDEQSGDLLLRSVGAR